MKKIIAFQLALLLFTFSTAQVKILFDATKAESAGNADWVIDADLNNIGYFISNNGVPTTGGTESNAQAIPTPAVTLGNTYAETYWDGGLSYWGLDCIKKGYSVESLPIGKAITYGNIANTQDLSKYDVFIVCEPNILFTATEKTAILAFVNNGGGLFMIADHDISDRNNDGDDAPIVWNDLMQNNSTGNSNPFGFLFNNPGNTAIDNISETSTNLNQSLAGNDSILHGPWGNVTRVKWSGGTTMTLTPSANPTIKPVIYANAISSPPSGNNEVMVAYGRYGKGKFVAFGDSSPFDDGTGDPLDALFTGYMGDVTPNHRNIIMNSTIWLVENNTTLPVSINKFLASVNHYQVVLTWEADNEINIEGYQVQRSLDGNQFENRGSLMSANNKGITQTYEYSDAIPANNTNDLFYRLKIIDKNGGYKFSEIRNIHTNSLLAEYTLNLNPVRNNLLISSKNKKARTIQYCIYGASGQKLKQNNITIAQGEQNISIDVKNLLSGLYIINIYDSNESNTFKFNKID